MSKRLEDIKRKYRYYDDSKRFVVIPKGNFNHLIEEAERVQELGAEIEKREKFESGRVKDLNNLREQNKRYREALEEIRDTVATDNNENDYIFGMIDELLVGESDE